MAQRAPGAPAPPGTAGSWGGCHRAGNPAPAEWREEIRLVRVIDTVGVTPAGLGRGQCCEHELRAGPAGLLFLCQGGSGRVCRLPFHGKACETHDAAQWQQRTQIWSMQTRVGPAPAQLEGSAGHTACRRPNTWQIVRGYCTLEARMIARFKRALSSHAYQVFGREQPAYPALPGQVLQLAQRITWPAEPT